MCPHCVGGTLLGLWLVWHEWREHFSWRFPRLQTWHKKLWCKLMGYHYTWAAARTIKRMDGNTYCRLCGVSLSWRLGLDG